MKILNSPFKNPIPKKIDKPKPNTENAQSKNALNVLNALTILGASIMCAHKIKTEETQSNPIAPSDLEQDTISKINEIAFSTKEAIEQIAEGKVLNQKEHTDEYFDNIENIHTTINTNWTNWQQEGDKLKFRFGHKAIFEHFNITPKQLSDVHRDIESLHMSLLKYLRTENPEYETLLPKLAQKILDDGTLDEMTKQGQKITRDDIQSDSAQWQNYWRSTYREIDRPTSDIEKLKAILN